MSFFSFFLQTVSCFIPVIFLLFYYKSICNYLLFSKNKKILYKFHNLKAQGGYRSSTLSLNFSCLLSLQWLFSKLTLCNAARKLNSCKNPQKYFPVKANGKKALGLLGCLVAHYCSNIFVITYFWRCWGNLKIPRLWKNKNMIIFMLSGDF